MKKALKFAKTHQHINYEYQLLNLNLFRTTNSKTDVISEQKNHKRKKTLINILIYENKIDVLCENFAPLSTAISNSKEKLKANQKLLQKLISIEEKIEEKKIPFTIRMYLKINVLKAVLYYSLSDHANYIRSFENLIDYYDKNPIIKENDIENYMTVINNYIHGKLRSNSVKTIDDWEESINFVNQSIEGFEQKFSKNHKEELMASIHYGYYAIYRERNEFDKALASLLKIEPLVNHRKAHKYFDLIVCYELAFTLLILKKFDADEVPKYINYIYGLNPKKNHPTMDISIKFLESFYLIETKQFKIIQNKIETLKKYLVNNKIDNEFIDFLYNFLKLYVKNINCNLKPIFSKKLTEFRQNKKQYKENLDLFDFETWIINKISSFK